MAFIIKHLDEGTYLERFNNKELTVWFTPKDRQALIFWTHAGAEKIAQKFNCLASKELQVQFYAGRMTWLRPIATIKILLSRGFMSIFK